MARRTANQKRDDITPLEPDVSPPPGEGETDASESDESPELEVVADEAVADEAVADEAVADEVSEPDPETSGQPMPTATDSLRRWRMIAVALGAAIVAVAAIGGAIVSASQTKRYEARANVQLDYGLTTGGVSAERLLYAQAVALRSRSVLAPIAANNDMTPAELEADVSSRVLTDSNVIEVAVLADGKDLALSLASEIVDGYLAQAQANQAEPAASLVDEQLAQIQGQLDQISAALDDLPSADKKAELIAERDALFTQRSAITAIGVEAGLADRQQSRVLVFAEPYVLDDPVSPRPLQAAAIAGLGGFFIALAAAWILLRQRQI